MTPNVPFGGSVQASREQQLEQELMKLKAELAAVKERAREDVSIREREIVRLVNKEACQEAMVDHLRWKVDKMTAEGRRLEEEVKKNAAIMAAIMRIAEEELSTRVLRQVYWITGVCYEARIHVDLDGLARQLAGGGNGLHAAVRRVKQGLSMKVEAAPASAEAKRKFLDGLPPLPALPKRYCSAMATPSPKTSVPLPINRPPLMAIPPAVPGLLNHVPPPTSRSPLIVIPPVAAGPRTPYVPAVIPPPIPFSGSAPVSKALTTRAVISNDKDDKDRIVSGRSRRRLQ